MCIYVIYIMYIYMLPCIAYIYMVMDGLKIEIMKDRSDKENLPWMALASVIVREIAFDPL